MQLSNPFAEVHVNPTAETDVVSVPADAPLKSVVVVPQTRRPVLEFVRSTGALTCTLVVKIGNGGSPTV